MTVPHKNMSKRESMTTSDGEVEQIEEVAGTVEVSGPQEDAKSAPDDRSAAGPFDLSEVPAIRPYIDLGSVKVLPREGLGMRLDVEEGSQRIVALSLDIADSTLQVQAFSAPKSAGVWLSILRQISAQLEQQGATPEQREGVFGPELVVAAAPSQPPQMRFIGVDGPRWVLRGTISGKALHDSSSATTVEELFRSLVVVRGELPMPPRELLPLRVPPTMVAQS